MDPMEEYRAGLIWQLEEIEADPLPCLTRADCHCDTCTIYCALWAELEEIDDA